MRICNSIEMRTKRAPLSAHLFIDRSCPDGDKRFVLVNILQTWLCLPGDVRGQAGVLRSRETTQILLQRSQTSHLYSNIISKRTLDRNAISVHYGHSINTRISLLKIVLIEKQLSKYFYLNIFYKLIHSLFCHYNAMCSVLTEVLDWLSGGGGWLLTSAELYKLEKLLFSSIIIIIRTQ